MVKHDIATGAYNQPREECEEGVRYFSKWDPSVRALRDVLSGIADEARKSIAPDDLRSAARMSFAKTARSRCRPNALTDGDLKRVGQLMKESHYSLRDLYEVSCSELDVMVDSAQGLPGFIGGRMTGGGFGGCTVNLVGDEKPKSSRPNRRTLPKSDRDRSRSPTFAPPKTEPARLARPV